MNGDEFLRFAGLLVARFGSDEAARRMAISRAYYGAYHLAVALLSRACNERLDHGSVRRLLKESGSVAALRPGRHLDDLQGSRIKADYRLDAPITVPFAIMNVERGKEIQTLLAGLDTPNEFIDLRNGIQKYLRSLSSTESNEQ